MRRHGGTSGTSRWAVDSNAMSIDHCSGRRAAPGSSWRSRHGRGFAPSLIGRKRSEVTHALARGAAAGVVDPADGDPGAARPHAAAQLTRRRRERWAQRLHAFLAHEGRSCPRLRLLTVERLRWPHGSSSPSAAAGTSSRFWCDGRVRGRRRGATALYSDPDRRRRRHAGGTTGTSSAQVHEPDRRIPRADGRPLPLHRRAPGGHARVPLPGFPASAVGTASASARGGDDE